MTVNMPIYEPGCTKTPGCYLGPFHYGACMIYTIPNTTTKVDATFYGMTLQEIQGYIRRTVELQEEVNELKREKQASIDRAKSLINPETGAYEIALSKPGRIEWPKDQEPTAQPDKESQPQEGVPGSFGWGPQSAADYEATEEHRRTNYGEFVRPKSEGTSGAKRMQRVEMYTVFEADADLNVWDAIEQGKPVESSLRILED